jgi:hypothetical protein
MYIFSDLLSVAIDANKSIENKSYYSFSSILVRFLETTQTSHQDFADELRFSRTSIGRWIENKNSPVDAMKVPILRYIRNKCVELAYDITQEAKRKKDSEEFWKLARTASESMNAILDGKIKNYD